MKGERVKYSVLTSLRHKGKALQVDVEREMVTLLGGNGDVIGSLSWDVVIDQVLAYRKVPVQKEVRLGPGFRLLGLSPELFSRRHEFDRVLPHLLL